MTLGICAVCGYAADIEHHHVAGEANYPTLTLPLCLGCHSEVTNRLAAHGVDMGREFERTLTDRLRALLVGYSVVFQLHLERHPNPLIHPETVLLLARLLSREMDRCEPADRPGRWIPDPTVPVREVMPAEVREGGDADMLVLFAQCALDVVDAVGPSTAQDEREIEAFRLVAIDPIGFMARAEQSAAGRMSAQLLLEDMTVGAERISKLLHFMLTHDPEAEWPGELLAEARLWGDTMRRLMEQLIELAGLTEQVGS